MQNAACRMKNGTAQASAGFKSEGAGRPMRRSLRITTEPIAESSLFSERQASDSAGAVIYFLGIVRGVEEGSVISAIDYEAFHKMAEHQFNLLFDEIEKRWPIQSVRLIHRIGIVKVSEPSLWVEVIAPHRGEAFAACQWLIDEMKRVVPIWKKPLERKLPSSREALNARLQ